VRLGELVGREREVQQIKACIQSNCNILLEGPVGVGKTRLALAVTAELGTPVFRIDGDGRYSEQKLSGWFDPPTAIEKGYNSESFMPGPLVQAMQSGGILFINELNRLPEGVQNILLPAIDERMVIIPRLGEIRARAGFLVLATQNPKEFVATSHLSEAILDRFELVVLDYQAESQEIQIVAELTQRTDILPVAAVKLIRLTRGHSRVRRGASIRAALSVAEIAGSLMKTGMALRESFMSAALLALPTRIEIEREADSERSMRAEVESLIAEWAESVLNDLEGGEKKKLTAKN
jgi:MoxR-like ATPase